MKLAGNKFLLCVALLQLFGVVVNAQDTVTGAFEGTVTYTQTGQRLRGAEVEIINEQTRVTVKLRSDNRGQFFQGAPFPLLAFPHVLFNAGCSSLPSPCCLLSCRFSQAPWLRQIPQRYWQE